MIAPLLLVLVSMVTNAGHIETLAAFQQLLPGLGLLAQAVQPNEPSSGVVIKLVAGLVGGQLLAVKAVVALAADDDCLALEQLHPHQAAHVALAASYERE